jgi:sedoheptulokinase
VKLVGLDIGTTTICGLVLDPATAEIVSVVTRPNDAALQGQAVWESIQDPGAILETARGVLGSFLDAHDDIAAVGVAGQMHGIVYVDRTGKAVSPLYTWQDGRGDLPEAGGQSTAARLSAVLGRRVSTGMGFVTHAWNAAHGMVPREAAAVCTIMDYVAMRAAGARSPVMDATSAASLGCFDLGAGDFRRGQMEMLGIDAGLFPAVARGYPALGEARPRVPVFAASGDNQASFLGSVHDVRASVLVNIGTGGQVSVHVDSATDVPGMDIRPFPFGGYLAVGAALCGGRAYALVREFFQRTLRLFGADHADRAVSWDVLNDVPGTGLPGDPLKVDVRFRGTREDPSIRGGISSIGMDNFTPEHLVAGVREGIASELLEFYGRLPETRRAAVSELVGSGNAIRLNPALREVFQGRLGLAMRLPAHREETSFGAALVAGVASGVLRDLSAAGELVRYERS